MKIKIIDKRKEKIEVTPESEEDLWTLKTVLRIGDLVKGKTVRDVSYKGRGEKERKTMTLKIKVKNIEFQPFTGKLRIFGIIVEGPEEYGIKGKHHSILLTPGRTIQIEREGGWPNRTLTKLESSGPRGRAVISAIDYDEYGIAVVSPHGFKIIADNPLNLPGKDDPVRENKLNEIIDKISKEILDTASKYNANLVVIGGPGSLKDKIKEKLIKLSKYINIITDNVSMGGRAGIEEILRRPTLANALREFLVSKAEHELEKILQIAASEPKRVVFGLNEALKAAELGAIDKLIIIEDLLYSIDDNEREKAIRLLDLVEKYRGEIILVPRDSPIGEKLKSMGGIIALLRYSLTT